MKFLRIALPYVFIVIYIDTKLKRNNKRFYACNHSLIHVTVLVYNLSSQKIKTNDYYYIIDIEYYLCLIYICNDCDSIDVDIIFDRKDRSTLRRKKIVNVCFDISEFIIFE